MSSDYRSHTSLALGTRVNSTLLVPAGIAAGDILVGLVETGGASAVAASPPDSSWTAITGMGASLSVTLGGWTMRIYGWWKEATGSEPANYTFTHVSGSTEAVLYCCSTSGATYTDPTGNPVPSTTNALTVQPAGTETAVGITTTEASSLVIATWSVWDGVGTSATPPAGTTPTFTERYDPGAAGLVYSCTGVMSSAGATGDKTINTANASTNPFLAALVAVAGPMTPLTAVAIAHFDYSKFPKPKLRYVNR